MARRPTRFPARITIPHGTALVAATEGTSGENSAKLQRLLQPWQADAFTYYNSIPEIWYAAQFYARALTKLRLFVGRENDQGELEELEEGDPGADLLDRIQDRGGGRSSFLHSYGQLRFLIGECYLTVTQEDEDEIWECLSPFELRVNGAGQYTRLRAPGLTMEELISASDEAFEGELSEGFGGAKTAWVVRLWKPDPQYSQWSDSSLRAVLQLCQELLLMEASVAAQIKSRIAQAGILRIATELDFGSADGMDEEDPNSNPFQQRLQQAMVTAIRTPGAASAVVPIVTRAPAEMIAQDADMKHLRISALVEKYPEEALRAECIRRIATGLDMPPELLLGMADANHWTAWQIDDNTWTAHLQPVAQQLVDDLTSAYLRPAAREEGIEDYRELVVGYDPADVINHPDRGRDAQELFDRGAVGYKALRDAKGFTDTDAQSPEEHDEYLAIKLRDPLQLPAVDSPDEASEPAPSNGGPPGDRDDVVETAPDDTNLEDQQERLTASAMAALLDEIVGAGQMAAQRARELAGSKIITKSRNAGCDDCMKQIKDVPSVLVASTLGVDTVAELNVTNPAQLVKGSSETFQTWLRAKGLSLDKARKLGVLIEQHAAKNLFAKDPEPLPPGFRVYAQRLL